MMRPKSYGLLAAALPLTVLVLGAGAAPPKIKAKPGPAKASADPFPRVAAPMLRKYCVACHTGSSAAGGIDLAAPKSVAEVLRHRKIWESVIANVSGHTMPPSTSPQPTQAERDALIAFLQAEMTRADCALNDPGRVTMRRLNRAEYNNTLRDLLAVEARPADEFPPDDVGYGFDNIGDVLSISPLLMEKYLTAARKVARAAIVAPEDRANSIRKKGGELEGAGSPNEGNGGRLLATSGDAGFEYDFPGPGEYLITAQAWGQQAGPEPCQMRFVVGTDVLRMVSVPERDGKAGTYTARIQIDKPGKRRVAVGFVNDYYDITNANPALRGDRNLMVESLEVKPPDGLPLSGPVPPSHRRLMTTRPSDDTIESWDRAARALLRPLARRAFRRPVTADEVNRLVTVTHRARERKQSFERGMQLALQAVLISPHFLFKVEVDPRPDDPKARRPLSDFELATRLSYFLWSSMPDEELLRVAESGQLKKPEVLVAQAKRMLADSKSHALFDNFAGQWLQLRSLSLSQPDTERFPAFNESLRGAMRTETELFFNHIVQQDRPVLEFLDADYSFLNESLAKHYGVAGVTGDQFRQVKLGDGQRGGLLGQGSILTLTSNPGRTSPVKRGKWVLENILGTPPPPPPPNVPQLPEEKKGQVANAISVRKRLEEHRKNPSCNACHQRLDGVGFALENFDAVGAWRTMEAGEKLDVTGALPDGSKFEGPSGLRKLLLGKKSVFTRALTERLLTYALGRGLENYDHCNVDAMAKTVGEKGYRFSAIVAAVVTSTPFRERRGDELGARSASASDTLASRKVAHK